MVRRLRSVPLPVDGEGRRHLPLVRAGGRPRSRPPGRGEGRGREAPTSTPTTTRTCRRSRGTCGSSPARWPSTSGTAPCRASSGSSACSSPSAPADPSKPARPDTQACRIARFHRTEGREGRSSSSLMALSKLWEKAAAAVIDERGDVERVVQVGRPASHASPPTVECDLGDDVLSIRTGECRRTPGP